MDHWSRHAASRVAQLEDPEAFFQELGETAAGQIASLSEQMEAATPPEPEYLARVAQLASIRRQAEEIVLNDLVFSVEPEPATAWEALDDMLNQLPAPERIEELLLEVRERAEEESERQGWSETLLSEDDRDQIARLTRMRELVTLPMDASELPAAEVTARIEALRPFVAEIQ